jgi:hypothetical protein
VRQRLQGVRELGATSAGSKLGRESSPVELFEELRLCRCRNGQVEEPGCAPVGASPQAGTMADENRAFSCDSPALSLRAWAKIAGELAWS